MKEGLSIYNIDSTNKDVVVTYTPNASSAKYSYTIIKDGVRGNAIMNNLNDKTDILLNATGTYTIEITTYDWNGNYTTITSGEYKIDKEAPIINVSNKAYKLTTKEKVNIKDVTASDAIDGDLTSNVTSNIDKLDFKTTGVKTVQYTVSDKAGNTATEEVYVTVVKDNTNLVRIGQIGIAVVVIALICILFKYIRSVKLEKRFSKYTINSSKNEAISLFDSLANQYTDLISKISKELAKSEFILKRGKRYKKYVSSFALQDDNCMKFMANKIVVGFIFITVAIIVKLIQSTLLQPYEMILPFIIGFYTLDIIYIYKYRKYRKQIEKDLLEAITIMNNSFKAGRSIIQAIELVSKELEGPIKKEFEKIALEISLGLDVEIAFKRFAERIKLSDAVYLTSSLSVLNRTGGNIIKVFDSIEKTVFARRKLEDELKALTSSSKLISYVLIFVPIVFVGFIMIINHNYFEPLYNNPLGIALIAIMVLLYVTYIVIVRKVMKVRM